MEAMAEDLVVLREILQRELETINAYEKMLPRVADPRLREIIEHVTDEEREHVSEMYQLIVERDVRQKERALRSEEQLRAMNLTAGPHAAGGSPAATAGEARDAAAAPTAAREAGLSDALLVPGAPAAEDPFPPPAPIFPDGAWSVGCLKGSSQQGSGTSSA